MLSLDADSSIPSATENSSVSSSNSLMSACKHRGKSLIQIRNKSESKLNLCGTPALTFYQLDDCSLRTTLCCLSAKKTFKRLESGPFNPFYI